MKKLETAIVALAIVLGGMHMQKAAAQTTTSGTVSAPATGACVLNPASGTAGRAIMVKLDGAPAFDFRVIPEDMDDGKVPWRRAAVKQADGTIYIMVARTGTLQVVGYTDASRKTVACILAEAEYIVTGTGGGAVKTAAKPAEKPKAVPAAGKVGTKTIVGADGVVSVRPTLTNLTCTRQSCDAGGNCTCVESVESAYDVMEADEGIVKVVDEGFDFVNRRVDLLAGETGVLTAQVARLPRPPVEAEQQTRLAVGGEVLGTVAGESSFSALLGALQLRANLADALPYLSVRGRLGAIDNDRMFGGLAMGPTFQVSQWDRTDISVLAGWDGSDGVSHTLDHWYGELQGRRYLLREISINGGLSGSSDSREVLVPGGAIVERRRFGIGLTAGLGLVF